MEMIEVEAFVTVADHGNFTRAAEALSLSQPAVSRRIELLEREVGAPLFDRIPSGARLTDAGVAFLPFARQVLAAVRDGSEAVRAISSGETGTISLALVGTLASTDLTRRLQVFRDAHPDVRLLLRTARSDEVSALVQRGEVSLGLRYFPDPSPAIESLLVAEDELVVVCAGHRPLAGHANDECIDPDVLVGTPWVAFPLGRGSSGEPFARLLERQLISAGLHNAEMIAIDSLTAQKRMIEAGFGLGLLPASSVVEEVRLGTLRTLPVPALATSAHVYAIHRRNGYLNAASRSLLERMIDRQPAN